MVRFPARAIAPAIALWALGTPLNAAAQSSSQPAEQPEQPAEQTADQPAAQPAQPAAQPEQPEEPAEQTFEGDPEAEKPLDAQGQRAAAADERTPEDVQSFADATLDAAALRFAFNAFGDVSLTGTAPDEGDRQVEFALGTAALLINGQLGESLLGTAEVEFDANDQNEQQVTLERLHLRWQQPSYFVVGGRMHTDLGYWNAAFHHGAWLHLPIARPRALRGEDEGGILPIHWIGIEGGIIVRGGNDAALTVAGGIGNGRGTEERDIPLSGDSNDFKALKLKIEYLGLFGLPDLRVGVGGLLDRIAPEPEDVRPALPDTEIDEYIGNAYAAYRGAQLTLIAEAYAIWHRFDDERSTTTDAFAVLGYRFGRLTPYLQAERTDSFGELDPYFTPVPDMPTPSTPIDRTSMLVGLRLDPSVWSALKLEYGVAATDATDQIDHSLALNWSFGI
jgi:hypothetical protein